MVCIGKWINTIYVLNGTTSQWYFTTKKCQYPLASSISHTTPKWIWIKSPDLWKRLSKPSNLMPKGSKKPCLKIPLRKKFFWHCPHLGLNQGPLDQRFARCGLSHGGEKFLGKKLAIMNITSFFCNSFINRSFHYQNFSSPWLSQQRVRPQI